MYASELLTRIRCDLDTIPKYISRIERERQEKRGDPSDVLTHLGDYNYATYVETCHRDSIEPDFPLDPGTVKECEDALGRYLDQNAPGNRDLKKYVTAISLYLVFIARRPLHPPDVAFSQEIRVTKRGESYVCTGKQRHGDNTDAICRFCVCQ
jgi:hypothetical protein